MEKCIIDDFGYNADYLTKIRLIKNSGFTSIFLNMRENKKSIKTSFILKKIKICQKEKISILFAHLPIDEKLNTFWVDDLKNNYLKTTIKTIKALSKKGIKLFVIHSYYKDIGVPLNDKVINNFLKLKKYATKIGVEILIENVDYFNQDKYIFEGLKNEFNFCYDIGHENSFYKDEEKNYLLDHFPNKIKALHLHDNNGKKDEHKLPFCNACNVNFDKLRKIKNIKNLPLTLECKMEKSDDEEKAKIFLEKAMQSIKQIEAIINS